VLSEKAFDLVVSGTAKKGDVLATRALPEYGAKEDFGADPCAIRWRCSCRSRVHADVERHASKS